MSIKLYDIEDIFLGQCANKLLKAKEGKINKFDKEIEFLLKYDFVSFSLIMKNEKIDLISPNYVAFTNFDNAIKSIIRNPEKVSYALKSLN